jgi:CysZ protein
VPLAINILVFTSLFVYGYTAVDAWLADFMADLPEWLGFLSWLIWFLAAITGILVIFFCFTMVANLIAAPFNALLSEKIEQQLSGRTPDGQGFGSLLLIIPRSVSREFSKLIYYLPRLIGLAIVSLIPGLNLFAPVLWLLFGAWMMSVQYTDFSADNNNVSFAELKNRLGTERSMSLEFGILVYLMLAIPLLNLIVIPVAVAGGVVFWVERLSNQVLADIDT